jgi:hypothetical protein
MAKKIFKYLGFTLLALIITAFAAPIFFKGKILTAVKQQLNSKLNATTNFSDVSISLFKSFPKLSVGIEDLSIVVKNEFENDTLVSAKEIAFAINLMSAIKQQDIEIYKITINDAHIKAHVLNNGKPNWNIITTTETNNKDTLSKSLNLKLEKYEIKNTNITYINDVNNTTALIYNLNHEGKGNFTNEIFALNTNTEIEKVDVSYGGIKYLNSAKVKLDATVDVNSKTNTYTFDSKDIWVNDLQLNTKGNFQILPQDSYKMDISFNTLSNSFKTLLSFIPTIYQNNFKDIQTKGTAQFDGFVKGIYNQNSLPAYSINIVAKDGYFKYPSLPTAVENIFIDAHIKNETGNNDDVVIDVKKGHVEIEKDPFDFTLNVQHPLTNLFINASAKGKLNLGKVQQYIPLQKGTILNGIIQANATIQGFAKTITNKEYGNLNAQGNIDVQQLQYKSSEYPDGVFVNNLNVSLTPQKFSLNNIDAQVKQSSFKGNGFISNFLDYAFANGVLNGVLNVSADNVNVNNWMGKSNSTASVSTQPLQAFIIPKNINFTINASAENIDYDKLKITNATGSLLLANETVKVTNLKGNSMNGTLTANGTYSTKDNKKQPAINFNYNINNVDIQQAFNALNTFEKIMPIGKFLNGKLNSQFNMSGILGNDLMPQLTSLSGIGNLLMLDGVLTSFTPLEKLANTLKVNDLKNISAKDIKAFIEFSNGKVLVKPFKVKAKGIDMEIGGLHGLNQDMDYTINMNIPRAMISDKGNTLINDLQNKAKSAGASITLAELIPVQVKMGGSIKNPTITTNLKQTGSSLANDLKNQVQSFVQTKVDVVKAQADSAKKALADTVKASKNLIIKNAKDALIKQVIGNTDTTQKTSNPLDDTKKQLEQKGKGLLDKFNPFKKKQQEVKDTTNQ